MEKVDIFDQEIGRGSHRMQRQPCSGFQWQESILVQGTNREFCKRASRSTSSTLCVLRDSLESRRTLQVQEHRQFLQFRG